MKINVTQAASAERVDDIPAGDTFIYRDEYFIRTLTTTHFSKWDTVFGTNLASGILTSFGDDTMVTPVAAEVNIP